MADSASRRALLRETAADMRRAASEVNPFLELLALVPKQRKGKVRLDGVSVLHEDSGSMEPAYHAYERLDDTEPFTKLFGAGALALATLGSSALKVFGYACTNLLAGNTVVYLSQTDYGGLTQHSRASYYEGLNELIASQFLAPTPNRPFFFINPSFFFNGNRLKMRHEFLVPSRSRQGE